jgi:hypothetical protein
MLSIVHQIFWVSTALLSMGEPVPNAEAIRRLVEIGLKAKRYLGATTL